MATKLQQLLNELKELKRYNYAFDLKGYVHLLENDNGAYIDFKDLEALILKYTETTPTYYKPRQHVRIIQNLHGHEFELSSIVTLIDRDIDNCKFWLCKDSMKICFLTEEEFEPIN